MANSTSSRKRMSNRKLMRIVVATVALVYGVVFIVLNRSKVRIHFVFFTVTSRLWVGLLICLVLGAILGQALGGSYRRRQSAKDRLPRAPGPSQPD